MNQAALTARVMQRLQVVHAKDVFAWTPALDLATELISPEPTGAQLDTLRRVLFRLGTEGAIEVAAFPRRDANGPLGASKRSGGQTVYELALGTSGGLESTVTEWGVRVVALE